MRLFNAYISVTWMISVAASSSLDSHVRVWDVDTGKCIKSMEAGPGRSRKLYLHVGIK